MTKIIKLSEEGKEAEITPLNWGQWNRISEQAKVEVNGKREMDEQKLQNYMLAESVKGGKDFVDKLSIRDAIMLSQEVQKLNFPEELQGKSSEQSQQENLKTKT